MDTELLLFSQIVGDFDDVKKLYNDGKTEDSHKLFLEKLKEIEKSVKPTKSHYEDNELRTL